MNDTKAVNKKADVEVRFSIGDEEGEDVFDNIRLERPATRFATICEQDGLHAQIQSIILSQTRFRAKHIFRNYMEFHFVIGFYYI